MSANWISRCCHDMEIEMGAVGHLEDELRGLYGCLDDRE